MSIISILTLFPSIQEQIELVEGSKAEEMGHKVYGSGILCRKTFSGESLAIQVYLKAPVT